MTTRYDDDLFAWTKEQAAALRAGKLTALDIEHIAEEIESLGNSDKRAVLSQLARLIQHLLKWQFQPEYPGRQSWLLTILNAREELDVLFDDSPSLRAMAEQPETLAKAWARGHLLATKETGLRNLPADPLWTLAQLLDQEFYPVGTP